MERIQEAIEKARKERQNVRTSDAQSAHVAINSPADNVKQRVINTQNLGWFSSGPSTPISVEYSQTQRIALSDDELKARRLVAGIAHDPRSEPYRQLRSQILQKMRQQNWRTLAITSPNSGNGKTLTALNLAISLSQEVNQTVMLVDLDLRSPSIANTLGLTTITHGIVDTLSNDIALEEILINPGYERLVIAPGTPQHSHTSEILSSPAMQQLQSELYHRYDDRLIIYDLPALLNPNVDATLLVIEDGGTAKDDLERSIDLLKETSLIGTIINKAQ